MIDWEGLEEELVAETRARVRELRERFEAALENVRDDSKVREIEQALELVLGQTGAYALPPPGAFKKKHPETKPASADVLGPEDEALFQALDGLARDLASSKLGLPPESIAFLERAGPAFTKLSPGDRASTGGTQLLIDCARLLDRLGGDLRAFDDPDALALVERAAKPLASALAARNVALFPTSAADSLDAARRLGPTALVLVDVPSELPAGSPIVALERGLARDGKVERPARIAVSSGRPNPLSTLLELALASLRTLPRTVAAAPRIEANHALEKLWCESGRARSDDEVTLALRYAMNALVPLDAGEAIAPVTDALLDALAMAGTTFFAPRPGERFDERHAPDLYERKLVSSDRPSGTVVRVLQPGFKNRQGVCVQRAIVAVAR